MLASGTNSESGQSLILIALLLVGLVGVLGLALDGGRALVARRASQNAADAAAFAGVRVLATHTVTATESSVWNNIFTFSEANGVVTSTNVIASFINASSQDLCRINQTCGGAIPAGTTGVRVTTTMQIQPYFIDILIGDQLIPIQAVAAAQSGPPSVGNELAPMAIRFPCPYPPANPNDPSCKFSYDVDYQLFGDPQFPGGFQWASYECASTANSIEGYLRLSKAGTKVLADSSDTYYNPLNPTQYNSPPPSPNPWVCSGPGVQPNSQIQDALDCWITPGKSGCWPAPTHYPGNRLWTVPVFDQVNGLTGSNAMYHTILFAEFEFDGYWFGNNQYNFVGKVNGGTPLPAALQACENQNNKCIMGRFKKVVANLEIRVGTCNTMGLDICGIGLSQ